MNHKEKIEEFVNSTKTAFSNGIKDGSINQFSASRTIMFLIERNGEYGVTNLIPIEFENPILGKIITNEITSTIKGDGHNIICGCETIYRPNENKFYVRYSSEVVEFEDIVEFDLTPRPQSVRDVVYQTHSMN